MKQALILLLVLALGPLGMAQRQAQPAAPAAAPVAPSVPRPPGLPPSQAEQNPIRIDRERSRVGFIDERTGKRLEPVYRMIDEERYADAARQLEYILTVVRLPFDESVVRRDLANAYLHIDQTEQAAPHLRRVVALDQLPLSEMAGALYFLAQYEASEERPVEALRYLYAYLPLVREPPANAYLLAAAAHANLKEFRHAIWQVRQAIERSERPDQSHYQIWLASHYELGELVESIGVLQEMITIWPDNRDFWRQLAGLYYQLEQQPEALASLSLAYERGLLVEERDFLALSGYYSYLEIPLKAAQVLADGLERGIVNSTRRQWEMLANHWRAAQEIEPALEAYRRATEVEASLQLDMMRAQMLIELERWQEAADLLDLIGQQPDFPGELRNPGMVFMLSGLALFEIDNLQEAAIRFERAMDFETVAEQAEQWLNVIRIEEDARASLAEAEAAAAEAEAAEPDPLGRVRFDR
jgi:hypothetical protein